MVYFITV